MEALDTKRRFLAFFKQRGHAIFSSSSLLPDDPSVLLTTAGMQQFKKYYTGEANPIKDFGSQNTASVQKSFRTSDIDDVGDETHLTFFEMLGNFSFGGYQKKEAITYAFDFIIKEMQLPISYVTIFKGSAVVPRDAESAEIWRSLGIRDIREEGMYDVFWGPTGGSGPCGPTTEIYIKNTAGQDIEIWNIVFNQFFYPGSREELLAGTTGKKLLPLQQFGVDTGMGLERLAMIAQRKNTIFETDLFTPLFEILNSAALNSDIVGLKQKRVIIDHIRGICFLLADGVRPSNKGAGYVLRRLMRRVLAYETIYRLTMSIIDDMVKKIIECYGGAYPELRKESVVIITEIKTERERFSVTLKRGLKELEKIKTVSASDAFTLYESFGLPYEIIKEIGGAKAQSLSREDFDAEFAKHQKISRAGLEKKFGGHGLLLDTGELKAGNKEELTKVTRLHTATHLLQRALRDVLGSAVQQCGSDITAERTRFDFSFSRKLTLDEIKKVEARVNEIIQKDLSVGFKELPKDEAIKTGALYFFKEKYPERVKVYYVGDMFETAYSKEFCGGPHVTHTGEIGRFTITKEEAVGAGMRRIRAVIE